MDHNSEIIWLKLLQQSNEEGLRALFDKYYTILCRYVYTLTGNEIVSEDIVQGIFIYLWENRHTLNISTSVKTYLFTAARNKALNYMRDNSRFTPLPQEINLSVYEDLSVEVNELYLLIEKAVQSLPEKCKEIFQLSRNEELTYKEIASRKGISSKTVEAQIHLAIKKIRKYLTEQYK